FINNGKIEQEHLDTLNQLLKGQVPSMGQQGGSQQSGTGMQNNAGGQQMQQNAQSSQQASQASGVVSDESLCNDMLMTEKYVSGTYDTAIFEFKDTQVRDILNHIQKEEQKHGEAIFKYMQSKGMYKPK
ncbi:MAG TPA: spore coat protein, partial [Clostridia bacterium]